MIAMIEAIYPSLEQASFQCRFPLNLLPYGPILIIWPQPRGEFMGTKITIGMFLRTKEEYGTAIIVPANIGKGVVLEQLREIVLALETEDPAATVKGAHALIIYSDGGLNVVFLESAEEKAKMIEELADAKREFTAHGVGG